jgi:hypothetical protein
MLAIIKRLLERDRKTTAAGVIVFLAAAAQLPEAKDVLDALAKFLMAAGTLYLGLSAKDRT